MIVEIIFHRDDGTKVIEFFLDVSVGKQKIRFNEPVQLNAMIQINGFVFNPLFETRMDAEEENVTS